MNISLRYFLLIIFILPYTFSFSNQVPIITNVKVEDDVNMLIIYYDISDAEDDMMEVTLRTPSNNNFLVKLQTERVKGDIGRNIKSGKNKVIEIKKEYFPDLNWNNFVPYIIAYDGTGFGNEMLKVERESGVIFLIDKFEVTNEQYLAFLESGGYEYKKWWLVDDGSITKPELGWLYRETFKWEKPRFWDLRGGTPYWKSDKYSNLPNSPVVGISWWESYAYAKWAGKKLPSDEDWETAYGKRMGSGSSKYPWGNGLFFNQVPSVYKLLNCRIGYKNRRYKDFVSDGFEFTAPVGFYSPSGDSPFGVSDLLGNVSEWLNDAMVYMQYYGTHSCAKRLLKGGSFKTDLTDLEDFSWVLCPIYRMEDIGFRGVLY
jgi:formylglycine-generating enzyme required for sulfatase activity